MISPDIADLVPRDKNDLERAMKAVELGYPAVVPIIPLLLEWLRDINWPVAQALQPMLAGIGLPIADDIRRIITGSDLVWTQWMLLCVVFNSDDLIAALRPEIEAVAALTGNDDEASDAADASQRVLRL